MFELYSIVDQARLELLRDLATGARLLRSNPSGLDIEQNRVRRTSPHGSGGLPFLLEIAFVQGLAEGDPFYPVVITDHGRTYVEGGYWYSGLRPGKSVCGRLVISASFGLIDMSDAVNGLKGTQNIGRILMSRIISLAQGLSGC